MDGEALAAFGAAVLLTLVPLTGCGGSGGPPPLTVLAAASLGDALRDGAAALASGGAAPIRLSFDGSQKVVAEVRSGAPADVVATADLQSMRLLEADGLVEPPVVVARNRLEIAVAPGNPLRIRDLRDLTRAGVGVVLADPAVPAGRLAREILGRAGVTVVPRSDELDVRAALEKVQAGDADAAIVYATDVGSTSGVEGVAIPDAQNAITSYPLAVVRTTGNRVAAAAFVREAVSGAVQRALRARGFMPP